MRRVRSNIVISLTSLAMALAVPVVGAAGTLVKFRESATVEGSVVTLGDIAHLVASDPADVQKLSAVIVGPAPAAGRVTPVSFDAVRSRLLSAGVDLTTLEFSGASSVTVKGAAAEPAPPAARENVAVDAQRRSEQAVIDAIRRYLARHTNSDALVVTPNLSDSQAAALISTATRGLDVRGGAAPWTGRQTFTIRFLDRDEQVQEIQLVCDVSARPPILAAKHALSRGHVLRPDDLVWRRAESEAEAACLSDPRALLGKETLRSLRAGEAISIEAVKSVPLVRNGQFVTVTSRRPGLEVQRVMKAKADGAANETIPVMTLEDHKTVLARVTGLQEAEIVETAGTSNATSIAVPQRLQAPPVPPPAKEQGNLMAIAPAIDRPRIMANPTIPLSVPSGETR